MREYIDSHDVANTVMMMGSAFPGTVAVVEGITDRRLYGKFVDDNAVRMVIAHSKDNVCRSVREVTERRGRGAVLGIVDSDLDLLNGRSCDPPLFRTDTRDSESMMFRSDAFLYVIDEYADPESAKGFIAKYGDIREAVLRGCYPLGMLMHVSQRNRLGLSFKDLDFDSFIGRKDLSCDIDSMIAAVTANSPSASAGRITVRSMLDAERTRDPWTVCRGHDIMSVMACGLRNIFGGSNSRHITGEQLAGGFRLAFSPKDLAATQLYIGSERWCRGRGLRFWDIRP